MPHRTRQLFIRHQTSVINAIRAHMGEEGEILVSYDVQNAGWRLSVADNGSGPKETGNESPHAGLGTSIVEALAHQLNATVEKTSGPQGTTVTITASAISGRLQ